MKEAEPRTTQTKSVTLQEERRIIRTKDKQVKNEWQRKCVSVFCINEECSTLVFTIVLSKYFDEGLKQ
jgi:hypothetical protein